MEALFRQLTSRNRPGEVLAGRLLSETDPPASPLPPFPAGGTLHAEPVQVTPRTAPMVVVFLCGYAVRVGFPIPQPVLFDRQGVPLLASNR